MAEQQGLCRDPERFEPARGDLEALIQQAPAGEIELADVAEAGFTPQPPNRSAWTARGDTHAVVSKRAKRLNVIGALLSSGRLLMAKLWHSMNGLWCFGFLMALIKRIQRPMAVILDKASIHTAQALEPYWELLKAGGLLEYLRKEGNGARDNTRVALNDVYLKGVVDINENNKFTWRGDYYDEDVSVDVRDH